MKLGNVSQSIVPVPKYFLNNKSIDLIYPYNQTETNFNSKKIFKKKGRVNKSYFRTRDLLSLNLDFNVNKNPRTNNYRATMENTKKYIPIYHIKKLKNNAEMKGTYFPDVIYRNNIKQISKSNAPTKTDFQNYLEYKNSSNIEKKINSDLLSELIHNTKNLIQKINMKFDLKSWNQFDSRTTLNLFHQPAYSPITDFNKNTTGSKEAFIEALRSKALGLKTISNKTKQSLKKCLRRNETEKYRKEFEKRNQRFKTEILVKNSKNNFLKLKKNNMEKPFYNKKDMEFILENKSITSRANRTKLYKEFPTALREEFIDKRIYKNKNLFKINDLENNKLSDCKQNKEVEPYSKDK